uniref:Uncharacterized protein n=1 Tax=Clytia hemisphaerica TaxID=252671 RepID=A0A7M5XAN4_9CNID
YSVTFLHFRRCMDIFGEKPKIALSSLYTESEERIFNALRGIGKDTSNRHRESVRDIGIVRFQSEKDYQKKYCHAKRSEDRSQISLFEESCSENPNSRIHLSETDAELHFKRIADYLALGGEVWWKREGDWLVFSDGDHAPAFRPEGPQLMSFESHVINDARKMLPNCWETCKLKEIDSAIRLFPVPLEMPPDAEIEPTKDNAPTSPLPTD